MIDKILQEIKDEAKNYLGHSISNREAEEISWLWEEKPYADLKLREIIEQYYKEV